MLFQPKPQKNSASLWMGITFVLALIFIGFLIYAFQPQPKNVTPGTINPDDTLPKISQHAKITFVHNAKDTSQKEKIGTFLQSLKDPQNGLKSTTIEDVWIDSDSAEGKEIIKKADAKYLPVAFFDSSIEKHLQFQAIQSYLHKVDDQYFFHLRPLEQLQTPPFADRPYKGVAPEQAKVVIVEYGSYTCHFCQQMESALSQILKAFPQQVSLVYNHYDRGGVDSLLAQASECANEQKKFWVMHDQLFDGQADFLKKITASKDPQKDASQYVQDLSAKLGLNSKNFQQCLDSQKYAKSIQDSTLEAANYGVEGTPGFFIGSKYYEGAMELEEMKGYIQEQLK